MADCPHCGTANDDGAMTCTACGQPMKKDEGAGMGGDQPAGGAGM